MTRKLVMAAVCMSITACASSGLAAPVFTTLTAFNSVTGGRSEASLVLDTSGNLYGTSSSGSPGGSGAVFEVAAGTHVVSTLVSFNGSNGATPGTPLISDNVGNLYGTTYFGGAKGYGTIFKIAASTNTFTTLAEFNDSTGAIPNSLAFDKSGNLYGTTRNGGANAGTVFELESGTNSLFTIASFNRANGSTPYCGLVADPSGNFYGTTSQGGTNGYGTVFEVSVGDHTLSAIAMLNSSTGSAPEAGLLRDSSGNLFGTASSNAVNGKGTVFEVPAGANAATALTSFPLRSDGGIPTASVISDAAGNLYGTTSIGGANSYGTIFELAAGTHTLTTLYSFTGGADGRNPYGGLVADASGNLFGTTFTGGGSAYGTVYELAGTGFVAPEPGSLSLIVGTLALLCRRSRSLNGPNPSATV